MKYQRFISLTAGLSFVLMFISSGVLYFIPDRGVTGCIGQVYQTSSTLWHRSYTREYF